MAGKILITGSNGQLGTELSHLIPNAVFTDITQLDITNADAVKKFINDNEIETVINCAAYTAVDRAEDDFELAYKINAVGPKNLAENVENIIHISTDYVFNGTNYTPYKPGDFTSPLSVYGKTKRAGEVMVLENASKAVIIRTAWLYSPYGNNFVKTMRRLGAEKQEINVVNDQIGTPTYAADLAKTIVNIIPQISYKTRGIYHFTNEGVSSWYDFAHEIMKQSGLQCRVNPIPSSAYITKAPRPAYSVLDKSDIKNVFGIKIQHWADALSHCIERMK
jgi:dTDP-4-dehydrorhamnose reductase